MTNHDSNSKDKGSNDQKPSVKFDLEDRTAVFGEHCIRFAKKIPVTQVNKEIIPQFVDATTSVGANYAEANDAQSKKDFRHKISICKKESKESKYWLRMIAVAEPNFAMKLLSFGRKPRNLI